MGAACFYLELLFPIVSAMVDFSSAMSQSGFTE
ncbi:hypothetical protein TRM7557_02626 [Tritonibacter multivorans]|uniref:Uncharacterized protein n=1 Tax=Tritonibacter multivorans TaxID=928856 RepID=A0A0N7M0A1_9RHOB|nr:hypothetical protein TRM7557_02626 [Tritonibacter multivorans]